MCVHGRQISVGGDNNLRHIWARLQCMLQASFASKNRGTQRSQLDMSI